MNYGLQISASGALSSMYRQDVLANNLANGTTVGFKPDLVAFQARDCARREDGLGFLPSNRMLERLGGGLFPAANRVDFEQGPLERTNGPLDVALEGPGFFVVRAGTTGDADTLRLTRDGRFTLNANGQLVLAANGSPVLDDKDRPISLPPGAKVTIDGDGTIRDGTEPIARLRIVDVPDRARLQKKEGGMYVAGANAASSFVAATATVKQRHVEQAAVDEVSTMMGIAGAGRDFEANIAMMQHADRLMERAINTFGRLG